MCTVCYFAVVCVDQYLVERDIEFGEHFFDGRSNLVYNFSNDRTEEGKFGRKSLIEFPLSEKCRSCHNL